MKKIISCALIVAASLCNISYAALGDIPVTTVTANCNNDANDYSVMTAAISKAGAGGSVTFSPSKTCLLDRGIALSASQKLNGNGVTIKRVNQITTTTTTGVTNNVTTAFTVATGTGANFRVGQTIALFNGANYTTANLVIQSIVGDVITISTTPTLSGGSPWSGTTTIALSFSSITMANGATIDGMKFDGNSANWTNYHWEITNEVQAGAGNNTVKNVSINNAPGEGIVETNASPVVGNQFSDNTITNSNGNGIHLSSSTGTRIRGNYIYNANLQGAANGHNGGCITISNTVVDYLISNNDLDTCRAGVGQIDSAGNSFFNISNNIMHNMSTYMLEIRGGTVNVTDMVITGNRFYNDTPASAAALIAVDITDTSAGTQSRVNVSGNLFHNTGFKGGRVANFVISNNTFETDYTATDIYHNHIEFIGIATNGVISGNSMRYGQICIMLGTNNAQVVISNNMCNQQYYYGINTVGGTGTNVSIIGNNINNDTNVNGSYQAITIGSNTSVKNNNVNIVAGHSSIRINGVAGAVVQGNTTRCQGAGKCIRIEAGSTGYVVSENQSTNALVDTPAVGVRVANNDLIL